MKLHEVYQLAIEMGINADPRGKEKIAADLGKRREKYDKLEEEKKAGFDLERLSNPYDDTRILWGNPDLEVKTLLAGIDIDGSELLLADKFRERGKQFDLVLGHHPQGRALARLYGVMDIQEDILYSLGVPINVAEGLMKPRIGEVERNLLPVNHNKTVDIARLLEIPLMCVHTPADNLVVQHLEELFREKMPDTVEDVMESLREIPEYAQAEKLNAGPRCIVGKKESRAGKVFVDMTGGTGGPQEVYPKLAEAGVGTIICMHMGEKHREEAEKNFINVVIAGHMASDSIGLNIFLDALEEKGMDIEFCSGLIRHSRL